MAQAARQYYSYRGYAGQAARSAAPERVSQPDVQLIPGTRSTNPALQSISPEFAQAFKLALFALIALAIICTLRVWLSAATVSTLGNVNELESKLTTAQATTNELEIQHSILSSSTRIEEEATKLGMYAPESVKYIKIVLPGKVALNADGSISLANTLQNIEEHAAMKTG